MLVYMCACSSSSMCQVGPQTPPHSSSQSTPTPPTCPAGGGCRRCVGGLAPGQDARVSAGPLSAIAWGAWPYWPCWAPIGGWGAFGSPGPGPGLPWCGRLPVEPAGLPPRHPGASTLWLSEVPPSGYPLPFSGGGRGCPCGGSPGGSVPWGAPGCLGPGSFPCLLHALRDGAVDPHTSIHIGVKTGAHRHTLS